MEYKILFNSWGENLEKEVNEYLTNGWKCQGGVCVVAGSGYYQAMVREKTINKGGTIEV